MYNIVDAIYQMVVCNPVTQLSLCFYSAGFCEAVPQSSLHVAPTPMASQRRARQKTFFQRTFPPPQKYFLSVQILMQIFCLSPGSAAAAGGREHSAEARWKDLQPDGQEPRRQAHPGGVPRGQQSGPAHSAGAFTRRRQLINAHAQGIFTFQILYLDR